MATTRFGVFYRFTEENDKLVVETNYFAESAIKHAEGEGWTLLVTDIELIEQGIADAFRSDERGFRGLMGGV